MTFEVLSECIEGMSDKYVHFLEDLCRIESNYYDQEAIK